MSLPIPPKSIRKSVFTNPFYVTGLFLYGENFGFLFSGDLERDQ